MAGTSRDKHNARREEKCDQYLLSPRTASLPANLRATLDGWSEKRTYYSRKLAKNGSSRSKEKVKKARHGRDVSHIDRNLPLNTHLGDETDLNANYPIVRGDPVVKSCLTSIININNNPPEENIDTNTGDVVFLSSFGSTNVHPGVSASRPGMLASNDRTTNVNPGMSASNGRTTNIDPGMLASNDKTTNTDPGMSASHVSTTNIDPGMSASNGRTTNIDPGMSASHVSTTNIDSGMSASNGRTTNVDPGLSTSRPSATHTGHGTARRRFGTNIDPGISSSRFGATNLDHGTSTSTLSATNTDDCALSARIMQVSSSHKDALKSGLAVFMSKLATGNKLPELSYPNKAIVLDVPTSMDIDMSAHASITNSNLETPSVSIVPPPPLLKIPPLLLLNDEAIDPEDTSCGRVSPPGVSTSMDQSDLEDLKAMTLRLNLKTRRPSYVEWHNKYIEQEEPVVDRDHPQGEEEEEEEEEEVEEAGGEVSQSLVAGGWSAEKRQEIDESLQKIRKDLLEMRLFDHKLASQLMSLRREIHRVKLQRSSAEHKVVLEQAFDQIEDERDEIAEVCDMPPDQLSPTLKQFGVTRMNISTRRFSVF